MSGKRQHYIPRFLQSGFGINHSSKGFDVWVYRKNRDPFRTNSINAGVEGRFYALNGDQSIDDTITSRESEFAALVSKLRFCDEGPVDYSQIPELVAHLEVRSRHLRSTFIDMSGALIEKLLDFVGDDSRFIPFLYKKFRQDPSLLRNSIEKEFARLGINQAYLELALSQSHKLMPKFFEELRPMLPRIAEGLKVTAPIHLSNAAKKGHLDALAKSIHPEKRVATYSKLKYSLIELKGCELILGDSMSVFEVADQKNSFIPFLDKSSRVNRIYLPLSSERILVGQRKLHGTINVSKDIPKIIARCSREFFISPSKSTSAQELASVIGESADPLTDDELEDLMNRILVEQLQG